MYIHLGEEKIVRVSELVAILDYAIEKSSIITQQFIQQALDEKRLIQIGEKEQKSLVITEDKVYISPISPTTLKKRAHQLSF